VEALVWCVEADTCSAEAEDCSATAATSVMSPSARVASGELADLFGDDGEAAALFAGAGGLDGGVEREQVGLFGDAGDGVDDAADLF
jgi:hypothetical protein